MAWVEHDFIFSVPTRTSHFSQFLSQSNAGAFSNYTMSSHREGVNPLRPYYIPPKIGEPSETFSRSSPGPNPFPDGRHVTGAGERYVSKARDMFSDLEYKDYLGEDSPSMVQNAKELLNELMWKYTSVLMAQPFEVSKTILQVRSQDENPSLEASEEPRKLKKRTSAYGSAIYDVSMHSNSSSYDGSLIMTT